MVAGAGDPPPNPNTFLHGDSPSSGNAWNSTQNVISFDKMKLTNNRASIMQGQICLHSMHKYQPKIHIQTIDKEHEGLDHGKKQPNFIRIMAFVFRIFSIIFLSSTLVYSCLFLLNRWSKQMLRFDHGKKRFFYLCIS